MLVEVAHRAATGCVGRRNYAWRGRYLSLLWLAGLSKAASRGDLPRVAAAFMTIGRSEGRDGLEKM